MDKEIIIRGLAKKGIKESELLAKYEEFVEQNKKDFEFTDEQSKNQALRKLIQYYVKTNNNTGANVIEYQGIFIGTDMNDYGVTKKYNEAIELFGNDPERAISKKLTNEKGEPLRVSGFDVGKPIDLSNVWTKKCLCVAKKKDSSDPFKVCILELKKEAIDVDVPTFTMCEFKGTDKETSEGVLNPVNYNDPEIKVLGDEMSEEQILSMTQECFECKEFSDIRTFATENPKNYTKYIAVRGDVSGVNEGSDGRSHMISITDPDIDIESLDLDNVDELNLTCWLNSSNELTCNEASIGVIVYGIPSIGKEDKLNFNAIGVYTPNLYRKPTNVEKYEDTEEEEVVVSGVEVPASTKVEEEVKSWIR